MADETLLSDLCSICTTAKSKYCCPGCSARTCSLPCYKRHQQWAQCSGKRDPTSYVKKSQMATPAGIDHDFNFLTGIERGLEKAERDVTSRGVATTVDIQKGPKTGEINPKAFQDAEVTVIRAPKGLSRQRENTTHRNTKRNIIWAVEWIHPDKSRLLTKTSEKTPLWEAYRDATGQPRIKKRKRDTQDHSATDKKKEEPSVPSKRQNAAATGDEITKPTGPGEQATENSAGPQPADSEPAAEAEPKSEPNPDTTVATTDRQTNSPNPSDPSLQYHFFLHKPRTSSTRPVLIPLAASDTLNECLRGRTVLEFPTIYVFPESTPPAEDFVLEEEYLKQEEEDQKEFDAVMKDVKPETLQALRGEGADEQGEGEVDSKRILDVLKQDLGGAV